MVQSHDDLCHAQLRLQVELNPLHGVIPRLEGEQSVGKSVHGRVTWRKGTRRKGTHGRAAPLVLHDPTVQSPAWMVPFSIPPLQRVVGGHLCRNECFVGQES